MPGTSFFPHHRRWDTRNAIVHALRCIRNNHPVAARIAISRAEAFNCIMYDCHDPLAYRYLMRINRIRAHLDQESAK